MAPIDRSYSNATLQPTSTTVRGGYARIYLKFTILKNYMHRALAAHARALAPRVKVGGMSQLISQLSTIQALNSKSGKLAPWGIFSCFHRWVVGPVNRSIGGDLGDIIIAQYSRTC
jgi:hypothetical protein